MKGSWPGKKFKASSESNGAFLRLVFDCITSALNGIMGALLRLAVTAFASAPLQQYKVERGPLHTGSRHYKALTTFVQGRIVRWPYSADVAVELPAKAAAIEIAINHRPQPACLAPASLTPTGTWRSRYRLSACVRIHYGVVPAKAK